MSQDGLVGRDRPQVPSPSRIIHVMVRGQLGSAGDGVVCRPAIVVSVIDDVMIRATVFCDTHEEHLSVRFDRADARGSNTWHWPEKVDA